MAMDELFQALRMFQDGAKEYATGSAIREAASTVKQINSIQQEEFAKRQQLEETGKQLALQLGSMGAPVSQIQSAAGAIMPQQLKAPEDFFSQSLTAGSPEAAKDLASAGVAFQKYLSKAPLTAAQQEQMKLGWAQLFGAQQTAKDTLNQQRGLKMQEELDKVDEAGYRKQQIQTNALKLKSLINESGTNVMVGPEGAVMDGIIYQMAVDYAKLVDPTSVAREGEVAAAQKYMLPVRSWGGMGYSNATAEKIIDQYLVSIDDRSRNMKASTLGARTGLRPMPARDAQIIESENRLKDRIKANPNDPKNEVLMKAIEASKRKAPYTGYGS